MAPQSHEIGYLEETQGRLRAWEIKSNPRTKAKLPQTFLKAYPAVGAGFVTSENFDEFLPD